MPLVIAAGAGAASRQAIGTAVVGGMIAATVMSLIFTPVFYVVMQKLSGIRKKKPVEVQEAEVQGSKVPRPKVQS
jgi:HAE1 family hydrophobic/amphiphilic exporter-1